MVSIIKEEIGNGRVRDDPSKQYGSGGKLQGKKYMLSWHEMPMKRP